MNLKVGDRVSFVVREEVQARPEHGKLDKMLRELGNMGIIVNVTDE